MYNNAVVPQTYSCVCVPHLESIAMQSVNVNCNPSQDMGGKDLPGKKTLITTTAFAVQITIKISSTSC